MSLTDTERQVFEELLRAGSQMCRKIGAPLPVMLKTCPPFVKAANAAERILDPLRTPAQRAAVEHEAVKP